MNNLDAAKQRVDSIIKMTDHPLRRKDDWRMEGIKQLLEDVQKLLTEPDKTYTGEAPIAGLKEGLKKVADELKK